MIIQETGLQELLESEGGRLVRSIEKITGTAAQLDITRGDVTLVAATRFIVGDLRKRQGPYQLVMYERIDHCGGVANPYVELIGNYKSFEELEDTLRDAGTLSLSGRFPDGSFKVVGTVVYGGEQFRAYVGDVIHPLLAEDEMPAITMLGKYGDEL